jgi:alanine-synthesizing transaminase
VKPGGRLREQRDLAYKLLTAIPGVTCVPAAGAMYLFPRLDPEVYPIRSDEQFVLDLLQDQKILVSHGSAFNWAAPDHFRFVILPSVLDIEEAVRRISTFLATYRSSVAA